MAALGSAHGQDNNIISTVINLFAAIKIFQLKDSTLVLGKQVYGNVNQTWHFTLVQPQGSPRNNAPVDLNEIDSPTLVVEAASSLSDDIGRKQLLYERLGVKEY